jgi:predicted HicB family RNase H-like nuclease
MKDVMEYKGFIGSVHFRAGDDIFFGKLEAINDLIMFEGDTVDKLKKAFREAVDDYLATCKAMGREPNKTFKGSFNVRIGRDLHVQAYKTAVRRGLTLNQLVSEAIEHEIVRTGKFVG